MPIGALALSVALTVLASSATHSPIAALLACLIAALAWRAGSAYALALTVLAIPTLARFDPLLAPHAGSAQWARLALLFIGAMAVGLSLRAMARTANGDGSAWPEHGREEHSPSTSRTPSAERAARDDALGRAVERDAVERLLTGVRESLDADTVTLWLRNEDDQQHAVLSVSAPGVESAEPHCTPPVESLVQWSMAQGLTTGNQHTDSCGVLVAPVARDDRLRWAISLFVARRAALPQNAKQALAANAARLGSLLDLLRDGRETRHYRGKAEVLARAAERVQGSHDVAGLGHAICDAALEVSGATRAAFTLWNEGAEGGTVISVSSGHPVPTGFAVTPESFVGTACRERQRFTVRETERTLRYPVFGPGEPVRRLGSLAVVPLQREGRALGAITIEGEEPGQVTEVETSLLLLLSSLSAAAYQGVRQFEEATAESRTDALTNLANRRVFDERLRQHLNECDRSDQVLSLILADLDNFKSINDTHGHAAGDRVLAAVAVAAKRVVRNIDLCARYGGEELAILLPQTPLERAHEVAERLRTTLESSRVEIGGHVLAVTASFGVASYPTSTGSHDSLFSAADKALYEAKHAGRNCVRCNGLSVGNIGR